MTLIKSLFLVLLMSPGVLTELVRTQRTVVASLGDEALLKCELTAHKDVLQVTWQRVTEGGTENMATYSKRYGVKIRDPFRDHVHFREAGLQKCSIVIESVKQEDESCYKCLFSAFPDGAISGKTCLKVYELHEPMLEVRQTEVRDDGLQVYILSCSVTGRPAPNVSWDAGNAILKNFTTTETVHNNGTTTITNHATAVIQSRFPGIELKVKCVAEDPFGVEKKEIYRRNPTIREVTAPKNMQTLVGLPFTLDCNVTLNEGDTLKQVQWIDNHENILLTYQPGKAASIEDRKRVYQTISETSYTAITLRKVGQEDNGCFKCVFDIYPTGLQRYQTCLTVTGHSNNRNSDSNWYTPVVVLAIVLLIATVGVGIWLHGKRRHQSRGSSSQSSAIKYPSDSTSKTNSTPASSSFKIQISSQSTLKKRKSEIQSSKKKRSMLASPTKNGQFGDKKCKRSLF